MTEKQIEVLLAFADNNMNIRQTAEAIHVDRTSVQYQLARVQAKTGLDPKNFHELNELLQMVGSTPKKSDAKVYKKVCNVCGQEFNAPSNRFQICSDECRRLINRQNVEKAKREYRKALRYEPAVKPKKTAPTMTLTEASRQARERGMTYGQFMVWLKECGR